MCDTCRALDFRYLPQKTYVNFWWIEPRDEPTKFLKYTQNCAICCILSLSQWRPLHHFTFELHSVLWVTDWASQYVLGDPDDSVIVYVFDTLRRSTASYIDPGPVICTPVGEMLQGHFRPRVVEETPNYTLAKCWLHCCLQYHGTRCESTPSSIRNLKLINCENMKVVEAGGPCHWLALSYVWGSNTGSVETDTSEASSRLPDRLSQTVKDAISVTRRLGYRFLWVDEYCIDQHNEAHRADQIRNMDQTYKGADLTIVAAAGKDKTYGLPGVNTTARTRNQVVHLEHATLHTPCPDPLIEGTMRAKWYDRAWTFQEGLLSRRLLVFTEHQMAFYCQTASWAESMPPADPKYFVQFHEQQPVKMDPELRADPFNTRISHVSHKWKTPRHTSLLHFMNMVNLYSCRRLTFMTDALNAFAGVMSTLRQAEPVVYNIKGLPYCLCHQEQVENGDITVIPISVEKALLKALSWHTSWTEPSSRRHIFPSWTWADWNGHKVRFTCSMDVPDYHYATFRRMQFEDSNVQQVLDTITAIRFEALIIPSESLRWGRWIHIRHRRFPGPPVHAVLCR
ncbi:HET-domain-containing protein [Decorospora gaudefroyi]|uniref:HET-domain-containing protein n=1 Tax=Decorospora gaudefroyi TaxID=184978 RepID=A0A6A5KPK9_9PLEO|nr:HET-domain-containing protein [Decorospora gaudefroyi]